MAKKYHSISDIKLAVIGGDVRQLWLARALAEDGYEVAVCGAGGNMGGEDILGKAVRCISPEDALHMCDAVILPLPYTTDGCRVNCPLGGDILLSEIFGEVPAGTLVLAGRVDEAAREMAAKAGLKIEDYYDREDVCIENAIPTAEGAAAVAMAELPITIHGSNAAVLGFGRVGKALANLLKAMGASVTVAARRDDDLAWIKLYGYKPLHFSRIAELCSGYDVVFNSVPARVLDEAWLSRFAAGGPSWKLIIDLASKPGGVDTDAAKAHGVKVIQALSLPGRVAPASAGMILRTGIVNVLKEYGIAPER